MLKDKPIEKFDWKDKIILIAEDVETNFLFLEEALRKTEVKIVHAQDGQEAVDFCKSMEHIDLVLMDIKMPNMNGYEATRQIKSFRKDLPIVAQTAFAMAGEKEQILAAGCDDYISKPIKPKDLLALINKYMK